MWFVIIPILLFRIITGGYQYRQGDRVRIETRVKTEPIRYKSYQRIEVAGLKTYLPLYPEIYYSDYIVIEGVVEDRKLINPVALEVRPSKNILIGFRSKLVDFYQSSLPEPDSSLVSGIILGSKKSIPEDFWEELKYTGTAHVVVASGMNVILVANFLIGVLTISFKRNIAIPMSIFGIWIYSYLSGFDAPIIRAAIMATIAFTAQGLGRVSSSYRALLLSAAIMLCINPVWINDLGFILSFAATASLLVFESRVRERIEFVPPVFREGLSTSLAAQIVVLPILYWYFGKLNVLSPVINALVLWTIPPITVIGTISGLFGIFIPEIGRYVILLLYPLTTWFVAVVHLFGKL